ncbi:hypothetical protein ACKKBF_B40100 [Auxenochlorella protothecoides x Auxenochlorella symbiontica]
MEGERISEVDEAMLAVADSLATFGSSVIGDRAVQMVTDVADQERIPRIDLTSMIGLYHTAGPQVFDKVLLCSFDGGFTVGLSLTTILTQVGATQEDIVLAMAKTLRGLLMVYGLSCAMPFCIGEINRVPMGVLTLDGTLVSYREWSRTAEKDTLKRLDVALQLTQMVHEVHQHRVVHLNLRLETVLARKDVEGRLVYLTGLEYAVPVDENGLRRRVGALQPLMRNINGKYASPELLEGHEKVTPKSDVFQLGIMLYELLNKKTLKNYFRHADAAWVKSMVADTPYLKGNPAWLETLESSLNPNPADRPDASELVTMMERAKAHHYDTINPNKSSTS